MVEKIVSGGQTGADRAALDVALEKGFPCGGWCPRGRRAEDGPLAQRYPLQETPSRAYEVRTEWNVRDSDGTLVFTRGKPTGGTAYTIKMARRYNRLLMVVDLDESETLEFIARQVLEWLKAFQIQILNVAGPRESRSPGIYQAVRTVLGEVLDKLR